MWILSIPLSAACPSAPRLHSHLPKSHLGSQWNKLFIDSAYHYISGLFSRIISPGISQKSTAVERSGSEGRTSKVPPINSLESCRDVQEGGMGLIFVCGDPLGCIILTVHWNPWEGVWNSVWKYFPLVSLDLSHSLLLTRHHRFLVISGEHRSPAQRDPYFNLALSPQDSGRCLYWQQWEEEKK